MISWKIGQTGELARSVRSPGRWTSEPGASRDSGTGSPAGSWQVHRRQLPTGGPPSLRHLPCGTKGAKEELTPVAESTLVIKTINQAKKKKKKFQYRKRIRSSLFPAVKIPARENLRFHPCLRWARASALSGSLPGFRGVRTGRGDPWLQQRPRKGRGRHSGAPGVAEIPRGACQAAG